MKMMRFLFSILTVFMCCMLYSLSLYTQQEKISRLEKKVGETFDFYLPFSGSSGYGWYLMTNKPEANSILKIKIVNDRYTFKALKEGKETLVFVYKRLNSQENEDADYKIVEVIVGSDKQKVANLNEKTLVKPDAAVVSAPYVVTYIVKKEGETFDISLPADPSGKYDWFIQKYASDDDLCAILTKKTLKDDNKTLVLTFKAVKPCEDESLFLLKRF